jgi:hypothetical protein
MKSVRIVDGVSRTCFVPLGCALLACGARAREVPSLDASSTSPSSDAGSASTPGTSDDDAGYNGLDYQTACLGNANIYVYGSNGSGVRFLPRILHDPAITVRVQVRAQGLPADIQLSDVGNDFLVEFSTAFPETPLLPGTYNVTGVAGAPTMEMGNAMTLGSFQIIEMQALPEDGGDGTTLPEGLFSLTVSWDDVWGNSGGCIHVTLDQ